MRKIKTSGNTKPFEFLSERLAQVFASLFLFHACLPAPSLINQNERSASKLIVPVPKIFSAQSASGDYINLSNQALFTVNGTCRDEDVGKTVEVTLDDGAVVTIGTPLCGASLTWSLDFDGTSYAEGLITVTANLKSGATVEQSKQIMLTKDVTIPTVSGASSSVVSPSSVQNSLISGATSADTQYVYLYKNSSCTSGGLLSSGVRNTWIGAGVDTTFPSNASTNLYGMAVDQAGNSSTCTYLLSYTHDNIAPDDPAFTSFSPSSPSNVNTPTILGTVGAGATTVTIYSDSSCATSVGTGTRSQFLAGTVSLTLSSDTSHSIYARAVDAAGNLTNCVSMSTYVEDSTAPTTPSALAGAAFHNSQTETPTFTLTADSTDALSGLADYEYRIERVSDGAEIVAFTSLGLAPSNPIQITGLSLATGDHLFQVYAKDAAGNRSSARTATWEVRASSTPVISPSTVTISINQTMTFSTTGGAPAYTYSIVSGGGSIVAGTGFFTAPGTAQTVTVRVTDSIFQTSDSTVTVINDTTAPAISSFTLAGGASTTALPSVSYSISATDDYTGVSKMYMSENSTPPTAPDFVDNYSSSGFFNLSSVAGLKTVYLWLMDGAGNISLAATTDTITLDFGSPPTVSITAPSTTDTVLTGSVLTIAWSCAPGSSSLATYPISIIEYTTNDGASYTTIDTDQSNNLTATTGSYDWTIPGALSGTPFRISVSCKSSSGIVVKAASPVMNSADWSIFAGNPVFAETGVNISNAYLGEIEKMFTDSSENIYFYKVGKRQLYKIDASTGLVTEWISPNSTQGCGLNTGSNIESSGMYYTMKPLGTTSDRTELFVFSHGCRKIFRIRFSDKYVTKVNEHADLAQYTYSYQHFLTAGGYFLYDYGWKLYKVNLNVLNDTPVKIYGNGSRNANTGLHTIGADATNLQYQNLSGGNLGNMYVFANSDASRVYVANYAQSEVVRIDDQTTHYEIVKNNIAKGSYQPQSFVAPSWNTDLVFGSISYGWPNGRWISAFSFTSDAFVDFEQAPFTGNLDSGGLKLGFTSTRLLGAYTLGTLLSIEPNIGGTWNYTKIGGLEIPTWGNGVGPTKVGFLDPNQIYYSSASQKLWINDVNGGNRPYARMMDLSNTSSITTSTVYSTVDARFGAGMNFDYTGTTFSKTDYYGYQLFTRIFFDGTDISSVTTHFRTSGCANAYPFSDGIGEHTGCFNDTSRGDIGGSTSRPLYVSDSKMYAAFANYTTYDNPMIYSGDGTTMRIVAGKTGAGGYNGADHGNNAIGATLLKVRFLIEVPSTHATNAGDLLILDGNRIRLVTIATESGSPKIYDLFDLTTAPGYVSGTYDNMINFIYDFDSETGGIGSGKIYYSTTGNNIYRITPASDKLSGVLKTYSFDSETFSNPSIVLTPVGLLVTQSNKQRILKTSP